MRNNRVVNACCACDFLFETQDYKFSGRVQALDPCISSSYQNWAEVKPSRQFPGKRCTQWIACKRNFWRWLTCFLNKSACTPRHGSADSINCMTSSIPHSCVGVLVRVTVTGDSEREVSAGVVEVAASCSGGGLRFAGGGLASQWEHSLLLDSKPVCEYKDWGFQKKQTLHDYDCWQCLKSVVSVLKINIKNWHLMKS